MEEKDNMEEESSHCHTHCPYSVTAVSTAVIMHSKRSLTQPPNPHSMLPRTDPLGLLVRGHVLN